MAQEDRYVQIFTLINAIDMQNKLMIVNYCGWAWSQTWVRHGNEQWQKNQISGRGRGKTDKTNRKAKMEREEKLE